jgi:hypothetical protein
MCRLIASCLIGIAALPGSILGHELWIQPDDFRPMCGVETPVRLFVGERFRGEELPWDGGRIRDLVLVSARGPFTLRGEPGAAPAAWARLDEPGAHLLAFRSKPATLEFVPDAFNSYLLEDGLYAPLAARRAAGALAMPVRERVSRYAKAVLGVAAGHAIGLLARPLGHRLEIVPETDVGADPHDDGDLVVRVLFEGVPLEGAVIFAAPFAGPEDRLQRGLTDAEGRCRFALDVPGPWMISLVHMVECHDCADADWDSSWATFVFARGDVAASLSGAR